MVWWASIVLTTAALVKTSLTETIDPIKWPAGTYGIPKPKTGCPGSSGFQWMTGSRSQDTNNNESKNNKSASFHLDAVVDKKKVKRSFCLKISTAKDQKRNIWPSGQYCIYKKERCPKGLKDGFVYWDDDSYFNGNSKRGILPDGVYDSNTEIEFCCRTDGNQNKPVVLPTKDPFYLLAYKLPRCQMVKWTVSSLEWIYYDTEHWSNDDDRGGEYPYNAATQHPTIYYCYYHATPAPTISKTKQRPDVISSTYTENHLSTNDDLNEERGKNKEKRQSDEEGVNVVAIVAPLLGLMLVALLLVGVFFYCRRKRKRKGESGNSRDTVHFRTIGAEATLVENPTYDLTGNHSDMTRKGESNLTANAITSTSENANQLYTEIEGREEQYIQTRETYPAQQNENPLYESAADKAVSNPLYDSNLITEMKKREAYLEQQEENPLYE